MRAAPGAMEQIAIMRRLLDHIGMQRIARDPALSVAAIAIDHAREQGLGGLVAGRVREFVDGEGERDEGEGDVEAFLCCHTGRHVVSLRALGVVGGWIGFWFRWGW